jgi:hypothetical protein
MILHELQQEALDALFDVCHRYNIEIYGTMDGYVSIRIGDFDAISEASVSPDYIAVAGDYWNGYNEIILATKEAKLSE